MTSSLRTSPAARLAATGAVALAALLLSGCGSSSAGAAAVVGQSRISIADVQTATAEITEAAGQDGAITSATLLSWMMVAPYVIEEAAQAEVVASDVDACLLLQGIGQSDETAAGPPEPGCTSGSIEAFSAPTLLAVRSYLSAGNTTQVLQSTEAVGQWWDEILDEVEQGGVEVNPRFGAYTRTDAASVQSLDALLAIVGPSTPDWIATPGE